MDPSRLTQKSQEALHDAQTKALRYGHPAVDGEHLLLALLDQAEGIVPRLMLQAGADPDRLRKALEAELERRPRVSGPGVAPGQVSVTQRLSRLLVKAQEEANRLKDEYVSVEHLVSAGMPLALPALRCEPDQIVGGDRIGVRRCLVAGRVRP